MAAVLSPFTAALILSCVAYSAADRHSIVSTTTAIEGREREGEERRGEGEIAEAFSICRP